MTKRSPAYGILTSVVFFFGVLGARAAEPPDLPVFPGAAGFGTRTPAGSGRNVSPPHTTIVRVTTLADSGSGSLRECVKRTGPRTCVFEVAGRIQLLTDLLIDKPFVTVAGQTAPAPGILLTGAGIRVAASDVLVQHLQVRPGDGKAGPKPENRDGVNVGKSGTTSRNVVLDHLSISWAIDENFDIWYATTSDVTLMNSIVSEGLYRSIHPKGPHGFGALIGERVQRVTFHSNLFAHNYDRNPRLLPGGTAEIIGNVVYGWGGSSSWNQANFSDTALTGLPTQLALIGNTFRRSPASPGGASLYAKPPAPGSKIFMLSNLGPTRETDALPEWKFALSTLAEGVFRAPQPTFPLSGVLPAAPSESLSYVLQHAGSRPRQSNSVDRRVISEVTLRKGTIKDCVAGCSRSAGGYPAMETVKRPFDAPADPDGDDDNDGYTNLEELLQKMAQEVE